MEKEQKKSEGASNIGRKRSKQGNSSRKRLVDEHDTPKKQLIGKFNLKVTPDQSCLDPDSTLSCPQSENSGRHSRQEESKTNQVLDKIREQRKTKEEPQIPDGVRGRRLRKLMFEQNAAEAPVKHSGCHGRRREITPDPE